MKRILTIITLVLLAVPTFAQDDWLYEQCEDTCKHIHGIDLSHYQKNIFWEAIGENHKMAYVYLKASEGSSNIDKTYADNIRMARKNGLKVGSYHFFRPKAPVQEQIDNFTAQCRPEDQDIIPMVDVETTGGLRDSAFVDSLMRFIHAVEKYYHVRPLVYSGENFYNHHLSGGILDPYKLMIAKYSEHEPRLVDGRDYTMWQYTSKGRIDGVPSNVDKSRFMGKHGMREIRFKSKNRRR